MTTDPTPDQSPPTGADEFYVNYFPVPSGLKRFLRLAAPVILSLIALIASGLAVGMRHPGNGTWSDAEVTLEGVLVAEPWPVLRVPTPEGGWETVLLSDFGKIGADHAVRQSGAAGRWVRITGTVIQRESWQPTATMDVGDATVIGVFEDRGRRMLELSPRPGVIEPLEPVPDTPPNRAIPEPIPLAAIALEGEIVDPKCYLGAMRPGTGEVHRACARVCIAGGIPAGLIAPGPDGTDRFFLLVDSAGRAVGPRVLERVGRPVRVPGTVERWGDLDVLRIDPDQIEAL